MKKRMQERERGAEENGNGYKNANTSAAAALVPVESLETPPKLTAR